MAAISLRAWVSPFSFGQIEMSLRHRKTKTGEAPHRIPAAQHGIGQS